LILLNKNTVKKLLFGYDIHPIAIGVLIHAAFEPMYSARECDLEGRQIDDLFHEY